ncbi:MAG TPA: PAS domain-containing protein, partial [Candidatus Hydrogenedentes bacterium]|nr:PAS domain-containing protein [Candidatus Hydrogenedentota bacterium]
LVTYWNPAAERILGYRAEEFVGRPLHDVLAPADQRHQYAEGLAA